MARVPELNRAIITARLEQEERYQHSAAGMQGKAAGLRQRATEIRDTNDRDTMLRLADGYERRADDAVRRLKPPPAVPAAISPSRIWPRHGRRADPWMI